jgi:hypothetical protein
MRSSERHDPFWRTYEADGVGRIATPEGLLRGVILDPRMVPRALAARSRRALLPRPLPLASCSWVAAVVRCRCCAAAGQSPPWAAVAAGPSPPWAAALRRAVAAVGSHLRRAAALAALPPLPPLPLPGPLLQPGAAAEALQLQCWAPAGRRGGCGAARRLRRCAPGPRSIRPGQRGGGDGGRRRRARREAPCTPAVSQGPGGGGGGPRARAARRGAAQRRRRPARRAAVGAAGRQALQAGGGRAARPGEGRREVGRPAPRTGRRSH